MRINQDMDKIVHYINQMLENRTVCGLKISKWMNSSNITGKIKEVTCEKCLERIIAIKGTDLNIVNV